MNSSKRTILVMSKIKKCLSYWHWEYEEGDESEVFIKRFDVTISYSDRLNTVIYGCIMDVNKNFEEPECEFFNAYLRLALSRFGECREQEYEDEWQIFFSKSEYPDEEDLWDKGSLYTVNEYSSLRYITPDEVRKKIRHQREARAIVHGYLKEQLQNRTNKKENKI